jgi:predicted AAA+ superfamily ATPase
MPLSRPFWLHALREALAQSPMVALLGPRQCGKSTLARLLKPQHYFDLESQTSLRALSQPEAALEPLKGLIVLDEIQRRQDLFPALRVLADRRPHRAKFLILGSASPELMLHSSETLAGRVRYIELSGLSLAETKGKLDPLWLRGGFPPSFLASNDTSSLKWREDYIRDFVERDLLLLQPRLSSVALRRFWGMLAHYHGQRWNASEIAGSMDITHTTARRYLDLLTSSYVVRQLPPFYENHGLRLVKAPKVYIRDSGLLHALLGLSNREQLWGHPKFGASWKGFAMEEILRHTGERHAFHWAVQGGAELDLLIEAQGKRWGFEFKASEGPSLTSSMSAAVKVLGLEKLFAIYPTGKRYPLHDRVEAVPLGQWPELGRQHGFPG